MLDDTSFGVEVAFEARVGRLLFRCRLVHLRVLERRLHRVISVVLIARRIQIGHRRLGVLIVIHRQLCRHVAELREHSKLHSLHRFRLPLLFARLFDRHDLLLVVSCNVFFVSDEHTYLHLLLDQVLSLSKVSNKLLPLHLFQDLHLVLVDNISSLQRLLLIL